MTDERPAHGSGTATGLGAAAMAANVLNLGFVVAVARMIGRDEYGALAALISAFLIVGIAGSALQITVAREVSLESAAGANRVGGYVGRWTISVGILAGLTVVLGILLRDQISALLGVTGFAWAAVAVVPTGVTWMLLSLLRGVLQGTGMYKAVGLNVIGEAAARLLAGTALVAAGLGVGGAFLASAISMLAMVAYALWALRRVRRGSQPPGSSTGQWRLSKLILRTWPALLALCLFALLQNTDVIMVRRMATPAEAGGYAADAVAAKVIIWVALGLGLYVVPETARLRGVRAARGVLVRAVALVAGAGVAMVAAYAVVGRTVIATGFGEEFTNETAILTMLAAAMTCLGLSYLGSQFMLALDRRGFLWLFAIAVAAQLAVLARVGSSPESAAMALLAVQAALIVAFAVLVWWLASRDEVSAVRAGRRSRRQPDPAGFAPRPVEPGSE